MGVLSAFAGIAVLLFGLVAGVWVDRMARRPILIGTDLARAALLATIPLAAVWHVLGMAQLYAVAALTSVLTVLFDVAYQSYLPSLVAPDQIFDGNRKLMTSVTAAEIAGPGLTGILVQTITAPLAILFDALSFVFSAAMVFRIQHRPQPRTKADAEDHAWLDSLAGLRFIQSSPILKPLAARAIIAWFFFGFMGPLYVLYAIRTLHLSPAQLGFTIATGGVGGIIGSLLSGRITQRLGLGHSFVLMAWWHAFASILIPLAHGSAATAMVYLIGSQLLGDGAFAIYWINETSLRQTVVPDAKLGRVNAAMQLASRGVLPLGALTGGILAGTLGIRFVLAIASGGVLLSNFLLFTPSIRNLRSAAAEKAAMPGML